MLVSSPELPIHTPGPELPSSWPARYHLKGSPKVFYFWMILRRPFLANWTPFVGSSRSVGWTHLHCDLWINWNLRNSANIDENISTFEKLHVCQYLFESAPTSTKNTDAIQLSSHLSNMSRFEKKIRIYQHRPQIASFPNAKTKTLPASSNRHHHSDTLQQRPLQHRQTIANRQPPQRHPPWHLSSIRKQTPHHSDTLKCNTPPGMKTQNSANPHPYFWSKKPYS